MSQHSKKYAHLAMVVAALLIVAPLGSQTVPTREYQIKAVFLFNFAQFVEWPEQAFADQGAPLVIGVIGEDPFGTYLDETVKGEKVKNRSLVVKRFKALDELDACHILFINYKKGEDMKPIFQKLKSQPTLTVGDSWDFASIGGMIRLATDNGKTRIQVNLQTVKDAELEISSKLLRLADVVKTPK